MKTCLFLLVSLAIVASAFAAAAVEEEGLLISHKHTKNPDNLCSTNHIFPKLQFINQFVAATTNPAAAIAAALQNLAAQAQAIQNQAQQLLSNLNALIAQLGQTG